MVAGLPQLRPFLLQYPDTVPPSFPLLISPLYKRGVTGVTGVTREAERGLQRNLLGSIGGFEGVSRDPGNVRDKLVSRSARGGVQGLVQALDDVTALMDLAAQIAPIAINKAGKPQIANSLSKLPFPPQRPTSDA